jgi:phosphoenolpyruvate carboxylase
MGMDVSRVMIPGDDSGLEYWSISSRTYVRNAVQNIKEMLKDEGGLKGMAKTSLPSYH